MCANFDTMKKKSKKIEVLGEEVMVGFVGIVDLIIKPRSDTTIMLLPPLCKSSLSFSFAFVICFIN